MSTQPSVLSPHHQSPLLITAGNTEISQISTGECTYQTESCFKSQHIRIDFNHKSHLYDMFIKTVFDGYHMIKTQTGPEDTRMRKVGCGDQDTRS